MATQPHPHTSDHTVPPSDGLAENQNQNMITTDIGYAVNALKAGKRVARAGWNGKGMWLRQQTPDANSKMTLPYVYIEYPKGHPAYPSGSRVPWLPSQADLLAEDWTILPNAE